MLLTESETPTMVHVGDVCAWTWCLQSSIKTKHQFHIWKITNATHLLVAHNPELSIRRRGMFKVDSLKYSFTRLDVYFNIILHELKIDTNVQSWHQRLCMSLTISDVVYFLRRSLKRYQVVSFIVWLSSHFSCNNLYCG